MDVVCTAHNGLDLQVLTICVRTGKKKEINAMVARNAVGALPFCSFVRMGRLKEQKGRANFV